MKMQRIPPVQAGGFPKRSEQVETIMGHDRCKLDNDICDKTTMKRPHQRTKRENDDTVKICPNKKKVTTSPLRETKSREIGSKKSNGNGKKLNKVVDSKTEILKINNESMSQKKLTKKPSVMSWMENISDSDTDGEESEEEDKENESADKTDKTLRAKSRRSPIEDRNDRSEKLNVSETRNVEEMIEEFDEDVRLPQKSIDKLRCLIIQLRHTVPPQHKIEIYVGCFSLTPERRALFEKYGPIRNSQYTLEENKTIVNNWEAFCSLHNWNIEDVKPFLNMQHGGNFYLTTSEERKKFVQFLADGLPWRTLYSVYSRFRRLYQPRLPRIYTPDEDDLIRAHTKNLSSAAIRSKRPFSQLAKIFKTTRFSVCKRCEILREKQNEGKSALKKKVKWTVSLTEKFILNLLQAMCVKHVRELKGAFIPKVIWRELEDKLEIRRKNLERCWSMRLHMQLFCDESIYSNDVKIKLIEYFYAKTISDIREIVWSDVVRDFDGMTNNFLSGIFSRLVCRAITKANSTDIGEIMKYLHEVILPELRETERDLCLPRVLFENGKIKILDIPTRYHKPRKSITSRKKNSTMEQTQIKKRPILNEEDLAKAVKAVLEDGMSICGAATLHGFSYTSLRYRVRKERKKKREVEAGCSTPHPDETLPKRILTVHV